MARQAFSVLRSLGAGGAKQDFLTEWLRDHQPIVSGNPGLNSLTYPRSRIISTEFGSSARLIA
jgi:hypothetical protein